MTIEEFKVILNDKSMQSKETNIKVYDKSSTGDGRMTIKQVHQELVEFKEIVLAFITEQRKFNANQEKNWSEQRKFNQYVLDVFKRNNLK